MKNLFFSVLLGASLVFIPCGGFAASEEVKIAYVDSQKVLNSLDDWKKVMDVLQGEENSLKEGLNKRETALIKERDELEKQGYLLSPETKAKRIEDYQKKVIELERFLQNSKETLQRKGIQLTEKIRMDVRDIIKKIGQDGGYAMILEMSEGRILYAPKSLDLTSEVIKRYYKNSK